MKRGLAVATVIIGILSLFCGVTATVLGAVGMKPRND